MALVEILAREVAEPSEALRASYIDTPAPNGTLDVYALEVSGWVLGRCAKATAMQVWYDGQVIRTTPFQVPRPDAIAAYPDAHTDGPCGYWTWVGAVGMPPEFEIELRVVLENGTHAPLGNIRARHQPLRANFSPSIQPLMITSLGRTGTTWLMRLLSEHPRIVAYREYPYEIRSAKYWMHTLKVLGEPANHQESAHWGNFNENLWWTGHHPYYTAPLTDHPRLLHWFGRTYVEELAAFCQRSIEEFYCEVARAQRQSRVHYFAEKQHADHIPWLLWELYPAAREIILVRDWRDVVSSILSFNAKRGYVSFGRERANNEHDFIQKLRTDANHLVTSWHARADTARLVRYEDLISHPAETLRGILQYLDLNSSARVITGMLERASRETEELRAHRTSAGAAASVGRWRRELDDALKVECAEAFGGLLREFGYSEA